MSGRTKWSTKRLVIIGLIVCAVLAGGISLFASSNPDGLERVAIDSGFADTAKPHANSDSPLANYSVSFLGDSRLGGSLAGIVGILLVALAAWGLFAFLRRSGSGHEGDDDGRH
jgi:uncharacterized membrane protein